MTMKQRFFVVAQDNYAAALEMTRSADSRARVRGLTLLSGVAGALNLALDDPSARVREAASDLVAEQSGD